MFWIPDFPWQNTQIGKGLFFSAMVETFHKVWQISSEADSFVIAPCFPQCVGKLCAALDRQHPRDLYDVKMLLDNEGNSEQMKHAFLVYLMGHNRPMAELLEPIPQDISALYRVDFEGMTYEPVSIEQLEKTFIKIIRKIHAAITNADHNFLLTLKRGTPDWNTFALPEAERLPSIRWKILNLDRMNPDKRKKAAAKLEKVLFG